MCCDIELSNININVTIKYLVDLRWIKEYYMRLRKSITGTK